jgi:hypothetical protein
MIPPSSPPSPPARSPLPRPPLSPSPQGDVKGKIPVLARDWSVKSMLTILDIVRDR